MVITGITDIKSTFWRFLKLFMRLLFLLVTGCNFALSVDPVTMTPASLDETLESKGTKKHMKRAHNNNDNQTSYQEKFLGLEKKQLENQVA